MVAEVCMAEERRAGQYWHSSLDRRVGDTWINGGSEACITIHIIDADFSRALKIMTLKELGKR